MSHSNEVFEQSVASNSIPLYAIRGNISKRHNMLKKLPFSKEMIYIFDNLCDFVVFSDSETGSVIELNNFKTYCFETKKDFDIQQKKFDFLILDVIKLLSDEEVQLVKILAHEGDGTPSKIQLLEETKKNLSNYKKIKDFVNNNFKQIKENKARFHKLEEMAEILKVNASILENFAIQVNFKEISLEVLERHYASRTDELFFVIQLDKGYPGRIVLPILSSLEISYSLVNLIKDFYADNKNEDFRKFLINKLEEKKLNPAKIHAVLHSMRIQDPYFLFFSQVFQTIVKNVYQKKTNLGNRLTIELINQLVSAILLSQISYNHRESIRSQQAKQSEKQEHLRKVLVEILKHNHFINGQKVYLPVRYSFVAGIDLADKTPVDESKKLIYGNIYSKSDFVKYIASKNESEDVFKEFLIFKFADNIYYLHRIRLVTCFITFTSSESNEVLLKLKKRFKDNYSELFSKQVEVDFNLTLERDISPIYKALHQMILGLLSKAKINFRNLKEDDLNYLISRLFLNELEILHYQKNVPDLCLEEADKKQLLLVFLKIIFNDYGKAKKLNEIMEIDFNDFRRDLLNEIEVNFIVIIFYSFKEYVQKLLSFLEADQIKKSQTGRAWLKIKKTFKNWYDKISSSSKKKEPEEKNRPVSLLSTSGKGKKQANLRLSAKEEIIKNIPELKNPQEFKSKLIKLLQEWNNFSSGAENQKNLEEVNRIVRNMVNLFSPEEVTKKNMDIIYTKVRDSNPFLKEILNQDSLKEYIFYKMAEINFGKLAKKS